MLTGTWLGTYWQLKRPTRFDKILTEAGRNNYTGVARRGEVHLTLQQHLKNGKNPIPGFKIHIEFMNSIDNAEQKLNRIIKITKPKYNIERS
jgi:hypothetical protein